MLHALSFMTTVVPMVFLTLILNKICLKFHWFLLLTVSVAQGSQKWKDKVQRNDWVLPSLLQVPQATEKAASTPSRKGIKVKY